MTRLAPSHQLPLALALSALAGACAPDATAVGVEDYAPRDASEALDLLLAGNERFVAGTPARDHQSIARRMELTSGQHPYATVLTCADSRVIPELVFDAGLGDLFVIRVAGNVVAEDEAGSIEYAVEHLGVPLVVVLGHEGCGAVTAALEAAADDYPELDRLLNRLQIPLASVDPSLPHEEQVHVGVELNAQYAAEGLRHRLSRLPEAGEWHVLSAVYELGTGRVRILEEAPPAVEPSSELPIL